MKLPEDHLKLGAVFRFDLCSQNGSVLLGAGTAITDTRTINKLLMAGPWVREQEYSRWLYSQRKEYWQRWMLG
jgi:hypothetical protein